jgi:hypothetical protein
VVVILGGTLATINIAEVCGGARKTMRVMSVTQTVMFALRRLVGGDETITIAALTQKLPSAK